MSQYIKKDCELGYVQDSAEIGYLKFNNLRHTVLGCMLGDFDEQGNYVISPEIRKELIEMKKYITESMDNIEICSSELKLDKQISFMVTYEGDKATLSLIEKMSYEGNFKINSGAYSNINEYLLDEVETSGEVNRNVLYQRWNIDQFGGEVIDIFNAGEDILEKYFGIINRFKYILKANAIMLDKEHELEEIEAEYSNKVLKLLDQFPQLKKEVEKELIESFKSRPGILTPDKPNFNKTFNEVLDKCLEENLSKLTEGQLQDYEIQMHNLRAEINIKRGDLIDTRTQTVDADIAVISNSADKDIKQISAAVNILETNDDEQLMTIAENGEVFAAAYRKYQERKKSKERHEQIEFLLAYLYAKGMLEQEMKAQAEIKPVIVVPPVSAAPAPTKKAVTNAKKPVVAAKGGSSSGGKGGKGGAKKPATKDVKTKPKNLVTGTAERIEAHRLTPLEMALIAGLGSGGPIAKPNALNDETTRKVRKTSEVGVGRDFAGVSKTSAEPTVDLI